MSTAHSGFWLKCLLMHRCIKVDDQRVKSSPTFIPKILEDILADDGLLTVRTYRNDLDRNLEEILHECDIVAELLWKLFLRTAMSEVGIPSLELCIYRLDVCVSVERPLV